MITLQDAQNDLSIQRIITYCPTSIEAVDLINTAQRMIMRRGDWNNTVVPIYVCVFNGCVVWPRYVQAVRKINHCNTPMQVENLWYQFMDGVNNYGGWHNWAGNDYGTWSWGSPYGSGRPTLGSLIQQGKTSVLQDIQGDGRLVRAYARCPQDLNKTITIFGTDNNGWPLQSNVNGTVTMGLQLVLQKPFASTPTFVRHIDYILKDPTECFVDLYAYNATTNLLEDLAHYEPSETRPSYERTLLCSLGQNFQSGTACPRGVLALVKLKYIPALLPTDLLVVGNLDALRLMIQSLKNKEAGKLGESRELHAESINEMNRELENQSPEQQTAAIDSTFGGMTFQNSCF